MQYLDVVFNCWLWIKSSKIHVRLNQYRAYLFSKNPYAVDKTKTSLKQNFTQFALDLGSVCYTNYLSHMYRQRSRLYRRPPTSGKRSVLTANKKPVDRRAFSGTGRWVDGACVVALVFVLRRANQQTPSRFADSDSRVPGVDDLPVALPDDDTGRWVCGVGAVQTPSEPAAQVHRLRVAGGGPGGTVRVGAGHPGDQDGHHHGSTPSRHHQRPLTAAPHRCSHHGTTTAQRRWLTSSSLDDDPHRWIACPPTTVESTSITKPCRRSGQTAARCLCHSMNPCVDALK